MGNILQLSGIEKAYVTMIGKHFYERSRLDRLEQINVNWIGDVFNTFSEHGELVVDLFCWAFGTAKPYLKLSQNSRFWFQY